MLCEVCSKERAKFLEEGTRRLLCSKACQNVGLGFEDSTQDAKIEVMLKLPPKELLSLCSVSKSFAEVCENDWFKRTYVRTWAEEWNAFMSKAVYNERMKFKDTWPFISAWIHATLDVPESWNPDGTILLMAVEKKDVDVVARLLKDERVPIPDDRLLESAVPSIPLINLLLDDKRVPHKVDPFWFAGRIAGTKDEKAVLVLLLSDPQVYESSHHLFVRYAKEKPSASQVFKSVVGVN